MENINSEIDKIKELLGDEWITRTYKIHSKIQNLPLQDRLAFIRNQSIPNLTLFNRHEELFDALEQIIIPSLKDRDLISIASVGCSTGQEPYTILLQHWNDRNHLKIEAYDINSNNIEKAIDGKYCMDQFGSEADWFAKIKKDYKNNLFKAEKVNISNFLYLRITMSYALKDHIDFKVHNISTSPLPEKFDIIFLVNVLLHYTQKGREIILSNIYNSLHKSGWLVCETRIPYTNSADYTKWMTNLEHLGFKKQKIFLDNWHMKGIDRTYYNQIYTKI